MRLRHEPFGMTLRGSDYVYERERWNVWLYNGKELKEDLNLQHYDYHARSTDPQTGRMNQPDPDAEIALTCNRLIAFFAKQRKAHL